MRTISIQQSLMQILVVGVLFGCAGQRQMATFEMTAPPASENTVCEDLPDTDPSPSAEPELSADKDYFVSETTPLTVTGQEQLVLVAYPGVKLRVLKFENGVAYGTSDMFGLGGRPIHVSLPARRLASSASDASVDNPTMEPSGDSGGRRAVHQYVSVVGAPGEIPEDENLAVRLGCETVEILAEQIVDDTRWQQVRQRRKGFEIIGWTWEPITHNWGNNVCPVRLQNRSVPPVAPGEDVDSVYVEISRETGEKGAQELKQAGVLWVLAKDGCQKWRHQNKKLTRSFYMMDGEYGHVRQTEEYGFIVREEAGIFVVTGPSNTATKNGELLYRGTVGCGATLQIVSYSRDRFDVIPRTWFSVAYHRDDVMSLFRTKKACEVAWAKKPRLPLDAPNYKFFEGGQRTFDGCL